MLPNHFFIHLFIEGEVSGLLNFEWWLILFSVLLLQFFCFLHSKMYISSHAGSRNYQITVRFTGHLRIMQWRTEGRGVWDVETPPPLEITKF